MRLAALAMILGLLAVDSFVTGQVQVWEKCGGIDWKGQTKCATGNECVKLNDYYHQCQPSSSSATSSSSNTASLWAQCGGIGFTGPKKCTSGASCVELNPHYFQCIPSSSTSSVSASTTTKSPSTSSSTKASTTTKSPGSTTTRTTSKASTAVSSSTVSPSGGGGQFPLGSTWLSGRAYDGDDKIYTNHTHITIWIGDHETFNPWWEGAMTSYCLKTAKTPVYYAYIIAFTARNLKGLQDCDVSSGPNLCNQGAQFVRDNRAYIVNKYDQFASNISSRIGRDALTVWLIEPDFYQYYSDKEQAGGTLSGEYMRALFDDFAKAIRKHLPKAVISWDISPWASNNMITWWGFFKTSPYITLTHTSGGRASPTSDSIKENELKYSQVKGITGLPILADCGYGVGGGSLGNCGPWGEKANIDARISNGVIGVSQATVAFFPSYWPKLK